ncbi:hypothetical protein SAMN05444005_10569 [Flavobacterium urocaniciphilum]|uniref:DUF998 domain-containing protein n=2 Tax=Flavobacterium urocaniciphilum TaxID=1299341 RepID=A0A1H9CT83_9FLAO|nr:hypothetical protein SAMN05444005_10569 [Flavobacterium urocaniciphilum]
MRKAIGWIAILLPFALIMGEYIISQLDLLNNPWFVKTNECYQVYTYGSPFKASISHYYYSSVGEIFTGALGTVALFLFCYKGHPLRKSEFGLSDKVMSKLAAFFALGIVAFPTTSKHCIEDNLRVFTSSFNTGIIHFAFAGLFFVTLAFISIFNFRRTKKVSEFGTKPAHNIYKYCGYVMLICVALILIYRVFLRDQYEWLDSIYPILILETIALIAFGVSWLTKGKVYKDF